jgi:hypothetical protein
MIRGRATAVPTFSGDSSPFVACFQGFYGGGDRRLQKLQQLPPLGMAETAARELRLARRLAFIRRR